LIVDSTRKGKKYEK
jgi:hypothetical protein